MNPKEQFHEFEGKSVEDAIRIALNELDVERDQVDIKVVCEEQGGLFGMAGAKPAKIKVFFRK